MARLKRISLYAKRLFDLLAAILLIIILFPMLLVTALLIVFKLGRPVIFTQWRSGKDGIPFKIYKFRTMLDRYDKNGVLAPDEDRITPFGQKLRSVSLDELPELINVIKGEMSLVGPRPLITEYMDKYNEEQIRRLEVKPGITGWAQVNGRNTISWEKKFKLDVWYVDNWNLFLDIKIIFLTIVQVFRREGINEAGETTASEFKGSQ